MNLLALEFVHKNRGVLQMLDKVAAINSAVNGVVWGIPMLILIIGTGIYMTARTKFFQITHANHV